MINVVFALAIGLASVSLNAPQSSAPMSNSVPACRRALDYPTPDNMIRPVYPKDALRKGLQGPVVVRVAVNPDGGTGNMSVLGGDPLLIKNTVTAIRKWHFHPIIVHDVPVETFYRVQVRFSLLLQEAIPDVQLESPNLESPPVVTPARTNLSAADEPVHRASEPGLIPPKVLYGPQPEFSEEARKKHEPGTVDIAVVVGADGLPTDLRIACSSNPDLNQNALGAVRQWKFAPAMKEGTPVAAEILVETSFKLY